jgi:hypothetical protein
MQIKALQCGDADAGFVQAALVLARTIDGMDDDMRQRMLPNTVGALLKTLETLETRALGRPIAARPSRLHALREARESWFP